jgi:hypothetical protein
MRRNSLIRRLSAAATLGLLALLVLTIPAGAWGVTWCRADPIVEVHGHRVQILVGVPEGYEQYVNGPIRTKIDTPPGLTRKVLFMDQGFNGHGETVEWGDLSNALRLTVQVPMNQSALGSGVTVPVEVTINSPWGTKVIYGNHLNTQLTVPLY